MKTLLRSLFTLSLIQFIFLGFQPVQAQYFSHYPESEILNKATIDHDWITGDSIVESIVQKYGHNDTTKAYVKLYGFINKTYRNIELNEVIQELILYLDSSRFDDDLYFFNIYIIADASRRNNDFRKAAQYFLELIDFGEKTKNLTASAAGNYQVAMVFYKLKDYQNSIFFFKEAYKIFGKLELCQIFLYRRVEILSNIGLSFNNLDQLDSANFYYQLALKEIDLNKNIYNELVQEGKTQEADYLMFRGKISRGVVLGNMGYNYLKMKDYSRAKKLLEESISINYPLDFERKDALKVATYLINIQYELKEYSKFIELTDLYLDEIIENKLFSHLSPVLLNLIHYYSNRGNINKSKEYFELYYKIANEDEKIEFVNFFNLINENRSLKEKLENEEKIRLLKESNEKYKINRFFTVFLLLILLLIGLFSVSLSIKSKKLKMTSLELDNSNVLLNKTNQELSEQIAENNIVLGMVAHDLKQPISNIKGLISLREGDENEYDKLILKSIDNAENLIQDLLDISRLESSTVYFEKLSTHQIKEDLEDSFKNQLITKKIDLYFNLNVPFIIGAKSLVSRMLTNLVSNAIKFSNEGKSIWVHVEKTELNEFCIKVQDEGIGMSEEVIQELFKPFTKASRRGTSKEAGTGLGMAIVEKIAKIHGGRIEVQSTLHEGSIFFIYLPSTLLNIQKLA